MATAKGKFGLTEKLEGEFTDAFKLLDCDKDGVIGPSDLQQVLTARGEKPTTLEVDTMLADMGRLPGAPGVTLDSYLQHMASTLNAGVDFTAETKELFKELDPEGTGYVTAKDLAEVMRALGNAPDAELDALLAESAKEGEDKVNYREYLKAMLGDVERTPVAGGTPAASALGSAPTVTA